MSGTTALKLTMLYSDSDTRTYTINDLDSEKIVIDDVKTKIKAFNQAAATDNSDVKKTFISDDGYNVTEISEAEIVTTTEEVIYSV